MYWSWHVFLGSFINSDLKWSSVAVTHSDGMFYIIKTLCLPDIVVCSKSFCALSCALLTAITGFKDSVKTDFLPDILLPVLEYTISIHTTGSVVSVLWFSHVWLLCTHLKFSHRKDLIIILFLYLLLFPFFLKD